MSDIELRETISEMLFKSPSVLLLDAEAKKVEAIMQIMKDEPAVAPTHEHVYRCQDCGEIADNPYNEQTFENRIKAHDTALRDKLLENALILTNEDESQGGLLIEAVPVEAIKGVFDD